MRGSDGALPHAPVKNLFAKRFLTISQNLQKNNTHHLFPRTDIPPGESMMIQKLLVESRDPFFQKGVFGVLPAPYAFCSNTILLTALTNARMEAPMMSVEMPLPA